jgi:hypothetical protein
MNTRTARLAGLSALLAVTVAVSAGCGLADAETKSAPPTPPTAEDLLLKSLPDFTSGSFRFAVKGGELPAKGVLDAAKHSYQVDITQTDKELGFTMIMNILVVEKQTWIKIAFQGTEGLTGFPKLPKKWMLVDPAKVKDEDLPFAYDQETDPGDTGAILRAMVDAQQTAPGTFTGTTDLTQQGQAEIVDAKLLAALGEKAKAVPFEARTDAQGRLSRMLVRIPAAGKTKASTYEVTYADYGSAPTPAEPAQQQKAPAVVYEMLNG